MSTASKTKAKICTDLEIAQYHLDNARALMVALDKDSLQKHIQEMIRLLNEIEPIKKHYIRHKYNK